VGSVELAGVNAMTGLTPTAASNICINQCKAMCCRGPIILQLTREEARDFKGHATRLGVDAQIDEAPGGGGWVRFSEHPGQRCPMLDDATSVCLIYEDRPQRCRDFPGKPTPGCAISGWTQDETE
jgi:Fe-S-cluster containining protein